MRAWVVGAIGAVLLAACGGTTTAPQEQSPELWNDSPLPNEESTSVESPADPASPSQRSWSWLASPPAALIASDSETAFSPTLQISWERRFAPNLSFADAKQRCADLASRTGQPWRLPTLIELASLNDFRRNKSSVGTDPTLEQPMWTVFLWTDSSPAFVVDAQYGTAEIQSNEERKASSRCVAGERWGVEWQVSRFDVQGDALHDKTTRLVWRRSTVRAKLSEGPARCAEWRVGNRKGRLPTAVEAVTLLDPNEPAIWQQPLFSDTAARMATSESSGPNDRVFVDLNERELTFRDGATSLDSDDIPIRCVLE